MSDRIIVWVQRFHGRKNLVLQWHDPITGKRKSESAKTDDPAVAEKARADKEYELNHGLHRGKSKLTWARFREIYTDEKLCGDSDNNQAKANCVFDRFEKLINPKQLDRITERTISTFATELRKQGLKANTIHGYLAYIKAALRWAHDQKMLSSVPRIEMPKKTKGTARARIQKAARITTEEYERLLQAAPNRGWRLLIAFAWHCGMRRNEATRVDGSHVDLDRHLVEIPKNKANDVAATAFITPELDELLRTSFPDGLPEGSLVDGVPEAESEVSRKFGLIARKAAVKGNSKDGYCTIHDLRRNYGSRWAVKVPAQVLQRMMRHSHISVTMDFYADTEQAALSSIWHEDTTRNT